MYLLNNLNKKDTIFYHKQFVMFGMFLIKRMYLFHLSNKFKRL